MPRWVSLIATTWPHLWTTFCSCCLQRRLEQISQTDHVVGDHKRTEHCAHLACAAQLELAQTTPLLLLWRRLRLDLAKHLLDAAAGVDRLGIALTAGGVLRHVRHHGDAPHFGDKALGARRLRDLAFDDQGMAVVHEHLAPVAGQCRMGLGFPAQQGIWIDAGAMGLVAELDAAEITLGPLLAGLEITNALTRA